MRRPEKLRSNAIEYIQREHLMNIYILSMQQIKIIHLAFYN